MYHTADFLAPWQDFVDSVSPSQQGFLHVYTPQVRLQVTSLVDVQSVFAYMQKQFYGEGWEKNFPFFSEKQNGLNLNFWGLKKKNTDILKNGHIVG